MKPTLLYVLFARLLLMLFALAVTIVPAAAAPAPQSLSAALDHILADPALRGGVTGAIVVRVRDGKTLYAHDADLRLLPASNRKLFTAAAALGVLGDGFTYKTQILAQAGGNGQGVFAEARADAQGVLRSEVVLRGAGDGALTTVDMDDLAAQIARAGVKRINGYLFSNVSLFTDGPYGFGWEWDDLSDEEFPVISSLEVNDGDVHVHVAPGRVGEAVLVTLAPPAAYPKIDSQSRTAAASDPNTCSVLLPYGKDTVDVSGSLPLGASVDQNVPVASPPFYAINVLDYCLRAHGIITRGGLTYPPSMLTYPTIILAEHVSLPMAQYLSLMMKPSDNLIAECLVRTMGAVKGKGGTYEAGHAVETPFFQSIGVDTSAIDLRDGSGVSRRNFVTARAVGQLLLGMSKRPDFAAYYNALPIAGVDGTLKSRMAGTRAAGNVHAKTGTLSQARALSGYVTGRGGDLYAFSLLMNNFPGNARSAGAVQDRFAEYLANTLPSAAH